MLSFFLNHVESNACVQNIFPEATQQDVTIFILIKVTKECRKQQNTTQEIEENISRKKAVV